MSGRIDDLEAAVVAQSPGSLRSMLRLLGCLAACLALSAGSARAATPESRWMPSPAGAAWTWSWANSALSTTPTRERYTVDSSGANGFRLNWTTDRVDNPPEAQTSNGTVDYAYTDAGLVNTNWSSTAPPPNYPVLCPSPSQCGNSLAGAHYLIIWGARSPVLQEPLVKGSTWSSLGGQASDVSSVNRYRGIETVNVPAFPRGVAAARVESDITQAGALGDPFGSGLRTTWWVYGVGPVKVEFRHVGGERSTAELQSTNLQPKLPPADASFFPLNRGKAIRFKYRNSRWLKQASYQKLVVGEVVNNTSRVDVSSSKGPIRLKGSYVYATRRSGITNLTGSTSSSTRLKLPQVGPRSVPKAKRRRFLTPLDLMNYGFNPILQGFPAKGQSWTSIKGSRDASIYGVTGKSTAVGFQRVKTPAGRFTALLITTTLKQPGFRYGSGTRKSWFASGVGLVKLQFKHRDGSVSTVERMPS